MLGDDVAELHRAAAGGHGGHIGPGLDLVGDDGVGPAPEAVHPPDLDDVGARAHDVGPHGVEEIGQIDYMGLFCGVFDNGHALGQGGGHHDVDGSPHGDLVQEDAGALDAASRGLGHDEAALGVHLGPQGFEALQVLVDGPGAAEVAAAGQGHVRRAEAAQQSAQHVVGGPALAGGFVGHAAVAELRAVHLHGVGVEVAHACAQVLEDAEEDGDIADLGDVLDAAGAGDHQCRGDDGDSGVLCAADVDLAEQGPAALNNIFDQRIAPLFYI